MNTPRFLAIAGLMLALLLPVSIAWGQTEPSTPDSAAPSWPVVQIVVFLVFGGLAVGAVIRSSRRHWN